MRYTVFFLIISSVLFVTACREGHTVDREGGSYVDAEPAGAYVDSGSGSTIDDPVGALSPVIDADHDDFVSPPGNYTQNATIDLETKKGYVGKDVVKLWLWNDKGSATLTVPEGTTATVLGKTLKIGAIGHDDGGEVQIVYNGRTKILQNRQEVKLGDTWIFISDVFLNAAQ